MRRCKRCGEPITDGDLHKQAKLCIKCREQAKKDVTIKAVEKAIPVIEEYLKKEGYPYSIRPLTIADKCPNLYPLYGIQPEDTRMLWIISNAIRYITTPNGDKYISPSRKKRRVFERTSQEEQDAKNL